MHFSSGGWQITNNYHSNTAGSSGSAPVTAITPAPVTFVTPTTLLSSNPSDAQCPDAAQWGSSALIYEQRGRSLALRVTVACTGEPRSHVDMKYSSTIMCSLTIQPLSMHEPRRKNSLFCRSRHHRGAHTVHNVPNFCTKWTRAHCCTEYTVPNANDETE